MKSTIYYLIFISFIFLSGIWFYNNHENIMAVRYETLADERPLEYTEEKEEVPYLININTANIYELSALEGIGEKKAAAIVEYRDSNGGFKDINELVDVNGIGETIFEEIKDKVTLEG